METLEAIKKRASLKTHLSAREVEQEKITKILDAARFAPSARNTQPWRFIVVRGKENVENVVTKAFFGFNQVVKEAPVLIIASANPSDDDIHEGREYYLFDVGVANYLRKQHIEEERGEEFGRAFEHFILMEILAYKSYNEKDFEINFWRTKTGIEVDFILAGGEIALEVKGASRIDRRDFYALESFTEEYSPKRNFIVCNEKDKRLHGKIEVIPWSNFLEELWSGNIL